MRKFVFAVLVLLSLMCTGCITLFSEIHQESHQNHNSPDNCEELEHRIAELEERVVYLLEIIEEREDIENDEEEGEDEGEDEDDD